MIPDSPVLIGGIGGSGTRAVCQILIRIGFFMGSELNQAYDAEMFKPFYKNCIRPYLENPSLNPSKKKLMNQIFLDCLFNHLKSKQGNNEKWGFKRPRSILLLPFLHEIFPKMKFIQLIRDGRDVALSENQTQVHLFGDLFCKDFVPGTILYNLDFWSRVNLNALDYGLTKLKDNHLVIRYEDLIYESSKTIKKIIDFTNTDFENFSNLTDIIHDPKTIGRWKDRKEEFSNMSQIAKSALKKFCYF